MVGSYIQLVLGVSVSTVSTVACMSTAEGDTIELVFNCRVEIIVNCEFAKLECKTGISQYAYTI